MNTIKKKQEQGQLQDMISEIWDEETDSRSQQGRSHWYII